MFDAMTSRFGRDYASLRRNEPLTDEQMRRVAPSIYAEEKHVSRSERYAYIPTADVLKGLRAEGFEVFCVQQARCRNEDKRDHTKHLLRLRNVRQMGKAMEVGDSVTEICLLNSHDGSSSYQMFAGVFRLICLNGLMVPDTTLGSIKVPHTGKVQDKVIDGAFDILDGCTRVIESRDQMKAVALSPSEQMIFARAALDLRYDEGSAPIKADQLLTPRRIEDGAHDLWTAFNRTQEHLVRGGLPGRTANNDITRTREITGIDQNVRLNKALWTLAEEMRKLKGALFIDPI